MRSACHVMVTLALLACFGVGCGSSGDTQAGKSGASGGPKFRIAVIPKGTSHDFWNSVEAGVQLADEEFDDVQVTWNGPISEGNTSEQIKIVESFIADGVDGISLAPLDAQAMLKPVEEALAAKIPVLVFDSGLNDSEGTVGYVASDNYQGGVLAAEYLAELLGGNGKIILMRYMIGSESTELREQGFLDTMKKYPDIEFLSDNQFGGPDEQAAVDLAEQLLSNFGDDIEGIFCPNESTTSGTLTALGRDQRGLAGKVFFVGFDSSDNLVQGLKDGTLHGTVLQDPVEMGYESVRQMRRHLLGEPVEPRIKTRLHVARFNDLDDPTTRLLLNPRDTIAERKQSTAEEVSNK